MCDVPSHSCPNISSLYCFVPSTGTQTHDERWTKHGERQSKFPETQTGQTGRDCPKSMLASKWIFLSMISMIMVRWPVSGFTVRWSSAILPRGSRAIQGICGPTVASGPRNSLHTFCTNSQQTSSAGIFSREKLHKLAQEAEPKIRERERIRKEIKHLDKEAWLLEQEADRIDEEILKDHKKRKLLQDAASEKMMEEVEKSVKEQRSLKHVWMSVYMLPYILRV